MRDFIWFYGFRGFDSQWLKIKENRKGDKNMIIGNIIKFGYGDIAVGSNPIMNTLEFQGFKPPQECGSIVIDNDIEYVTDKIKIELDMDDCLLLRSRLRSINDDKVIDLNGYILDFTKFNQASVDVALKHLNSIVDWMLLAYAC